MLRLVLSELIRSLIEYNVNIKREKAQKALECIDNTSKKINKLKIILHKEYRVPLDKPKNPLQL